MAEQNVKITVTAEDRASGPIKNVESALGGLEKGTSKAGGAMHSLGHAAEVAVGTMATAITTYGIAAVQNLNREMVKLSLEQSKFQSQTENLLKNAGMQSYSKQIENVIGQHSELSSIDDTEIRKSFNNLIAVTKDYERSLKLLSAAEDYSAAQGIGLESATKQVAMALSGSTSTLEQNGVVLDALSMKSMTAAQKADYLAKQLEKSFGGSAEALRNSTAGIFANFENQVQNIKTLFGDELTGAIAPTLENIAAKISGMIKSGEIQPLVDSFGNLLQHSISFGSELGNVIMKLAGVTSSEEAITKLADAFDRVSYILGIIEDALSRISVIIKDLHLDKIIDMGLRVTNPGGMALWDYAGQQVQYEKAGAYTPYEAGARGRWTSPGAVNPNTLPGESETAADALGRLREIQRAENENKEKKQDNSLAVLNNTQNVLSATELLKLYRDQTTKTGTEVDALGRTAGSAISYMNSAMSTVRQMLNPGGGGGGGCRTFTSGERVQAGNDIVYEGPERGGAFVSNSFSSGGVTYDTIRNIAGGGLVGYYNNSTGEISRRVNDALIKKDGSIVNFHPDDNILAFKDGSKLQGKNVTINNTFNISGNGDPDRIADEIMKRINRITRVGF
jgi:hypothetical protein